MDQTAIAEAPVRTKSAGLYTCGDILLRQARDRAEKIAVIDGRRSATYAELLRLALGYAALLRQAGAGKGDRVAIFLPRSIEALASIFAAHFAGAAAVVIPEVLHTKQVDYVLEHSGASLLIADSRVPFDLPGLAFDRKKIINLDKAAATPVESPRTPALGNDLAFLIYTSGSTGMPKGIMVSHNNVLSGATIVADYLDLTEEDRIIGLLPFSFDYGLNQAMTALLVGGTLAIQRSLFPAGICRTLSDQKVTGIAGVPTLWLQLTGSHSPFLKWRFPHLRYVTNSGGRLPESVVRQIRKAHPEVQIFLMYGLTEAFRSTYLSPDQADIRPDSIGKAIPNVEILVIDEEGKPCGPGEVGELVHRGANVTLGYWKDPEATAKAFRPNPLDSNGSGRETVVFSGDLVKRDAEGYLYFVGRRDQLIKTRGYRVSPEEIETWLFASGMVAQAVAFGLSEDYVDSRVVVAVVPKEPETFSVQALDDYFKSEMPEYMRPKDVWPLEELPLTSSGKPDRVKIKQLYVESR